MAKTYRIYQIQFEDGTTYTGMTKRYYLSRRINEHKHNPANWQVADRLRAGMKYEVDILNITDSLEAARQLELACIAVAPNPLNLAPGTTTHDLHHKRPMPETYGRPSRKRRKERSTSPATCSWCRERLPASEFHSDRSRHNGLTSKCKTCSSWKNKSRHKITQEEMSKRYFQAKKAMTKRAKVEG